MADMDELPRLRDIMRAGFGLTDALAWWSMMMNTPGHDAAYWWKRLSQAGRPASSQLHLISFLMLSFMSSI
jgi:hypothetical protein